MALWTPQVQVSFEQSGDADDEMCGLLQRWWPLHRSVRYKEHEDGFLRLQLIRYESVELTEQLMRERQSRQADEEDEDQTEGQEMGQESPGATPSELQVELRGVLLEEQRAEETAVSTEEGSQEDGMLYVLTGGLSQAGDDSIMQQLQDNAQQQMVWLPHQSFSQELHMKRQSVTSWAVSDSWQTYEGTANDTSDWRNVYSIMTCNEPILGNTPVFLMCFICVLKAYWPVFLHDFQFVLWISYCKIVRQLDR